MKNGSQFKRVKCNFSGCPLKGKTIFWITLRKELREKEKEKIDRVFKRAYSGYLL